jgi:polysaccharide export outer membrane protein
MFKSVFVVLSFVFVLPYAQAQQPRATAPVAAEEFLPNRPANVPTSSTGEEYRIGSDDLIEVSVFEVPNLAATVRVSATGIVSLPLIGTIEATGKTAQQLEAVIEEVLRMKYLNDPHVTVFVREYASQPVSVVGSVKVPGIYQIKGQKFLLDMLAMAQGLDQNAGKTIQVMRRATADTQEPQTINVSTEDLFEKGRTDLNILIHAGDVINVLQAGSIFVVGEVIRPGEFVLRQGRDVTASQAVALGGGFSRDAQKDRCLIIRLHRDGSKEEIPVNVGKILDGSLTDVALSPNDILFVPANKLKSGLMKALDTTIATLSGRVIYRF